MAFFTNEEKKEFFKFFQWEDGKEYQLTIEKEVIENFANGRKEVTLHCTDLVTGQKFDRRFEFGLMSALDRLGDDYVDATTKLLVTPKYEGKTTPKIEGGATYDRWSFKVEVGEIIDNRPGKKKPKSADTEEIRPEDVPF